MTAEEQMVMGLLAQAWNVFRALPGQHPSDKEDFLRSIHACENIVMARPTLRGMVMQQAERPQEGD